MTSWFLLIFGLVVLVAGAELLVRGASSIAARLGISSLVIGLTVVAFGTSAPEIAVSITAARSNPGLSLGNVVGSNIFNVLVILGVSAMMRPLAVDQKLVRIDIPLMIGVSIALWLLLLDGVLGRMEAAALFAGIVAYVVFALTFSPPPSPAPSDEVGAGAEPSPRMPLAVSILLTLVGLAATVLGARLLIESASTIALRLGVSDVVVGLTIVAAGTSVPELATSLVAVVRGERDIAIGNVVGSNIFNILGILGLAGLMTPGGMAVPNSMLWFDLPIMVAVAAICLPIAFTDRKIGRGEGAALLVVYLAYVSYLVLSAL